MIAVLRILMKDVNIASSTALQAINPDGREEGIRVGCKCSMPILLLYAITKVIIFIKANLTLHLKQIIISKF